MMSKMYKELAGVFAASPDRNKRNPSLALRCEVVAEHNLLGRAICNKETELVVARLYACVKDGNPFVFFRADERLQGFIVASDPPKFVTLSELGYMPEHNASVDVVIEDGVSRWVDSIGPGDGYSYWLVQPRWSETRKWIIDHV